MNDHIDPGLIAKVKEWAKVRGQGQGTPLHLGDAVAEFITAMPDQMIDADKVREQAKLHRKWAEADSGMPGMKNTHTYISEVLESLLPAPPLSTLKDLIEEGHDPAQYQWVQAEHRDERCIIIRVPGYPSKPVVSLLTATGATIWASTDEVIPHPDKPRLVWPAESPPEPGEGSPTPEVAPKVLITEEDYRDAPNRTIVAEVGGLPFYASERAWLPIGGGMYSHCDLAGTPRRVLRWGMGEQA